MFTGIIESIGTVQKNSAGSLVIEAPRTAIHLKRGDSVAVNGVCLTVIREDPLQLHFDVMENTAEVSTISKLKVHDSVNIERAATPQTALGGHLVQGHIDSSGTIAAISKQSRSTLLKINIPKNVAALMIEKGSVAVDGVSVTIAQLETTSFTISLIPTTLSDTTLGLKKTGDLVNIEADVLSKYVKKHLAALKPGSDVTEELLKKSGFLNE